MSTEDKIKELRKQLDELRSINYEMVESNGHLCIRDGKYRVIGKYRVMTCFSKELGNSVLESLKSTIASRISILENALSDMDSYCSGKQQSLFGKE